jgi:uncharacterized protein YukE
MRAGADGVMGVDAGTLRDALPDFAEIAGSVDTALAHLRDALSAEGECWGLDDLGRSFGPGYGTLRDQAQDAFGELARAIDDMGTRLGSVADTARAADDRGSARLTGC